MSKEKLVLALDVADIKTAEAVVDELKDYVGVFKVGKELFTAEGPEVFRMIKRKGGKIFADLKYHDIPNTVASAARVLVRHGVEIFNVHAQGCAEMIRATREAIDDEAAKLGVKRPVMLAVTVLTSLSDEDLKSLNINMSSKEYVIHLAKLAKEAGADGVVASPQEAELIKKELGSEFVVLTPGIRPAWSEKGDQKRIMTPNDAMKLGVDYIVIGRPIMKADNRVEAAKKVLEEMKI